MGEDWFEPALNIHTPLPPLVPPLFFVCPSSNHNPKKTILTQEKYYVYVNTHPHHLTEGAICFWKRYLYNENLL